MQHHPKFIELKSAIDARAVGGVKGMSERSELIPCNYYCFMYLTVIEVDRYIKIPYKQKMCIFQCKLQLKMLL